MDTLNKTMLKSIFGSLDNAIKFRPTIIDEFDYRKNLNRAIEMKNQSKTGVYKDVVFWAESLQFYQNHEFEKICDWINRNDDGTKARLLDQSEETKKIILNIFSIQPVGNK